MTAIRGLGEERGREVDGEHRIITGRPLIVPFDDLTDPGGVSRRAVETDTLVRPEIPTMAPPTTIIPVDQFEYAAIAHPRWLASAT